MKTRNLLLLALIALLVFQSCDLRNKFGKKNADASEADNTIAFYNRAVQLDDYQSKYSKALTTYLDQVSRYVTNKLNAPQGEMSLSPFFSGPSFLPYNLKNIQAPKALGAECQKLITELETSFEPLPTYKSEIGTYLKAEDYKDDKGAKIEQILANVEKVIAANKAASDALFAKIEPQVAKAEEEIMKDHPLKKQITQSKELLSSVKQAASLFGQTDNIDSLNTTFSELYTKIEANLGVNRSTSFPRDESYKSRKSSFDRFNSSVDDYLGKMRIVQRQLKEDKQISESEVADLERQAGYVLDAYNSFVD